MLKQFPAIAFIGSLFLSSSQVSAADSEISRFVGEYIGRSVQAAPHEVLLPRDLTIKISLHEENGFTLEWTTLILDRRGERLQSYSIDFSPTSRAGIFSTARASDPLKVEPYVWASISGPTLIVHELLVTDDGGYEMQIYQRTLTAHGMKLQFFRNRNGQQLKTINGMLARKAIPQDN
jgi:hypothetical protein